MDNLPTGYIIDNTYEIKGVLGRGGFGITYRAVDLNLQHEVAIKEYAPVDLASRSANYEVEAAAKSKIKDFEWGMENFLRGARTLARFNDPRIVRVYRFFRNQSTKTAYLVMEMVKGRDLIGFAEHVTNPDQIQIVFQKISGALELVHDAKFQHRDIKPENILIRQNPQEPVLIDFDSARQNTADRTVALVTPYYSALEQYSSDNIQGPYSDIYSLCASFVRVITGSPPPDAPSRILDEKYEPLSEDKDFTIYDRSFLAQLDAGMTLLPQERPQSIRDLMRASEPSSSVLDSPLKSKGLDSDTNGADSRLNFPSLNKTVHESIGPFIIKAKLFLEKLKSRTIRFKQQLMEFPPLARAGIACFAAIPFILLYLTSNLVLEGVSEKDTAQIKIASIPRPNKNLLKPNI